MIKLNGLSDALTQIRKEVARAKGAPVRAQKWAAARILEGTVRATPVDTGRLRGGWQIGIGTAPAGEPGVRSAGEVISSESSKLGQLPEDQFTVVWVANNVEYADIIEFGGISRQAPNGMLGPTVARVEQELRIAVNAGVFD